MADNKDANFTVYDEGIYNPLLSYEGNGSKSIMSENSHNPISSLPRSMKNSSAKKREPDLSEYILQHKKSFENEIAR
jgi:hypothetical protein